MPDTIRGTVIERSFVGRQATNIIHVASAPVAELGKGQDDNNIKEIIAELLGIPRSIVLDNNDYQRAIPNLLKHYILLPPHIINPLTDGIEEWKTHIEEWKKRTEIREALFSDFIAACATIPPPLSHQLRFRLNNVAEREPYGGLRQEALATAIQCYLSSYSQSLQTTEFLKDLHNYEIPLGQSSPVKSHSLLDLLKSPKTLAACVAPLIAGGTYGPVVVAQGNYITALLVTAVDCGLTHVPLQTTQVHEMFWT